MATKLERLQDEYLSAEEKYLNAKRELELELEKIENYRIITQRNCIHCGVSDLQCETAYDGGFKTCCPKCDHTPKKNMC